MQRIEDPAAGMPPQMLPHMHLVSKFRYPLISTMSLETVVGYLTEAQKIVRDLQPVQWQYLDAPQDGSLLLVWQPLQYLDTTFASDGYVWGDVEQAFSQECRGYSIEMWLHRSGYKHPGEPMACHSRRRYRLLPSKSANTGVPNPDPALWIVHYQKAERRDCIPAQSIPIIPQVNQILQQRRLLQGYALIARKEFMLNDHSNWPTFNLPAALAPISHAQAFASNIARQQQANIMGSQQGGATMGQISGSRAGQMAHVRGRSTNLLAESATVEEEEDVSRGDMLDFISPRDISKMRYEQHHEWMEEIMSSPYATKQIIPTDLGLGRKGELEALTNGFFEAPVTVMQEISANAVPARVGRLESNKAEEFTKMAAKKISDMQADLDRMKEQHSKRMEKLRRTTVLNSAERRLRRAPNLSDAHGDRDMVDSSGDDPITGSRDTVEDVVRDVEAAWGRKIEPMANVVCVQKGGLEQRTASYATSVRTTTNGPESPMKNLGVRGGDRPASDRPSPPATGAEHQGKQMLSPSTSQAPTVIANTATVQSEDFAGEPRSTSAPDEADMNSAIVPSLDDMDVDVEMSGVEDQKQGPPAENGDGSEWVMVAEQGDSASPTAKSPLQQAIPSLQQQDSTTTPADYANTPGSGVHSLAANDPDASIAQPQTGSGDLEVKQFDTHEFGDVDVDTAGDALVDYGDANEDLDLDVMDDSAFGDAFHPPDDANSVDNDFS